MEVIVVVWLHSGVFLVLWSTDLAIRSPSLRWAPSINGRDKDLTHHFTYNSKSIIIVFLVRSQAWFNFLYFAFGSLTADIRNFLHTQTHPRNTTHT